MKNALLHSVGVIAAVAVMPLVTGFQNRSRPPKNWNSR
jgi:hypothetical protein